MTEYASFRQRLDAVLRTFDVKQVQTFLLTEKQWDEGTPADPEFAMYMMIIGSPTLSDIHARARTWLVEHGHEAEVQAVLGPQKKPVGGAPKKRPGGNSQGQGSRPGGKGAQWGTRNGGKQGKLGR